MRITDSNPKDLEHKGTSKGTEGPAFGAAIGSDWLVRWRRRRSDAVGDRVFPPDRVAGCRRGRRKCDRPSAER